MDNSLDAIPKKLTKSWWGNLYWVDGVLILFLISIQAFTLDYSNWVWEVPPLFLFALIGAFIGWLLGMTRWSLFVSIIYSFLMAFVAGVQYVGRVVPFGLNTFMDWLEVSNWQIFLYIERMQGWQELLRTSKVIYDQGYWSTILILMAWVTPTWLLLCLQRRKNTLLGLIPMLATVGAVLNADREKIILFIIILFFGLMLIHSRDYQQKEQTWQTKKMDYPEQLWLDKTGAVVSISILVLLVAGVASILATAEGWQDIYDWFDELRRPAVAESGSPSSEYVFSPLTRDEESLLLLQPLEMSRVGAPLPMMEGTVMWVRVSESTPRPWRMAIYDTYTGTGWQEAKYEERAAPVGGEIYQTGRRALVQRFNLFRVSDGRLFSAAEPVQAISDGIQINSLLDGSGQIVTGFTRQYELISMVPNVTEDLLRLVDEPVPDEIQEMYLQLPDSVPLRVYTLAGRLIADEPSYYEKVIRVQDYVRQVAAYDLEAPLPGDERDVVDYFLFDAPSGFCTYYASAMAVLLRMQEIPARVVTGYAPGVFVVEQGNFEVTGDLAHAWVEVYFPGYGWIPFEPTPSQTVPSYAQLAPGEVEKEKEIETRLHLSRNYFWYQLLVGLMVTAGALIIGWVFWKLFRLQRQRTKDFIHPVALDYWRLRMGLEKVGVESHPWMTLREYLSETKTSLTQFPHLVMALSEGTHLLERVMYSPDLPQEQELNGLRKNIRDTFWEFVRLRVAYWKRVIFKRT